MKTNAERGKSYLQILIYSGIIFIMTTSAMQGHAQTKHSGSNQILILEMENNEINEGTPLLSIESDQANQNSKVNKRIFGDRFRMLLSLFKQPLVSRRSIKDGPYDVIIVPGFPYRKNRGAGLILRMRIRWAHHLISKGIAKNVIFSGGAVYTPYIESQIMALHASELGIPADHIFCETNAEHSTENIVYSYQLARELGFKKIAIATGPFQSAFLSKYVDEHSLPVSFVSITKISGGKIGKSAFTSIDPSSAYVKDFASLKDRESRKERQEGTLGNKISRH
jgi:hypothetical protein